MKVALSVPSSIHRAADAAARRMRIPRSQLYARAMAAFLRKRSNAGITARLNAVYSDQPGTDAFLAEAALRTFKRNK